MYTMTIDGKARCCGVSCVVTNPATMTPVGEAPVCSRADLDDAVAAARRAFSSWRKTPFTDRAEALEAIAKILRLHAEELARLQTEEQGKPLLESRYDVLSSAEWFEGTARLVLDETRETAGTSRTIINRRIPVGVVAAIAPWNFPLKLATLKIAPALLAGNTVVLKPSPFTPLSTLRMGELLKPVLPPGVLNVISGDDDLGPWLTSHPGIDKIAFTGSTATGRKVLQTAARGFKHVTLELGGNDPGIVFPDVDIEQTAENVFWSSFRNCGQLCIATKRLYVHDDIYPIFFEAFADYAASVRQGNGLEEDVLLGPLQNEAQYSRISEMIASARNENGQRVVGGNIKPKEEGYFISPCLLDNPDEASSIIRNEQFGPVLPVLKFASVEEVIKRANDSEYGLGATIWCRDMEVGQSLGRELQVGSVWLNQRPSLDPHAPFGGLKHSGVGVEGALSGLYQYTDQQSLHFAEAQAGPAG